MAAGLGFKTFTTGEVLTAADVNGYLMQGILVFATEAARDSAITSPQEGQFAFTKDTNSLWYYTGSAWVASGATGDIEGVTAGVGISGGGTSGTVTITNSMATAIDAKGDLVVGTGADAFSRLAIGSNNTVLTADSAEATGMKWAAAAAAGDSWTLLNAGGTNLSGSTTVTVSGISGKNKLMIIVTGGTAPVFTAKTLRFNGNTGANYQAFYLNYGWPSSYGAGSFTTIGTTTGTSIPLGTTGSNSGSALNGYLMISGCNNTNSKAWFAASGCSSNGANDSHTHIIGGGVYTESATISSVSIISASAFTGGQVFIYASS